MNAQFRNAQNFQAEELKLQNFNFLPWAFWEFRRWAFIAELGIVELRNYPGAISFSAR
jgi:hypothetical protein